MAKKILITGASGLIGKRLTELLLQQGHEVVHLGRSKRQGRVPSFTWDVAKGAMDPQALVSVDAIIHLAGAGIADKRWTASRKKEIMDSRVQSIDLLYGMLRQGNHQVTSFISASGTGYYGNGDEDRVFTEGSPPGSGFLAEVARQWEEAAEKINTLSIRVVKVRIGLVLSGKGGVLKSMAAPVRLGVGAALGSGNQYMSWIHIDDLCGIFAKAVEDTSWNGAYNAVSVRPVTNLEMTRAIARVLKRPLWLPAIPSFVLRFFLGELSMLVTTGSKVSSEKVARTGFVFQFTDLQSALNNLLIR